MIPKSVQGEIFEPILIRRERDEIDEGDFHHIVREIVKCCSSIPEENHDLTNAALKMVIFDISTPPEERAPGAPGARPRNIELIAEHGPPHPPPEKK